MTGSPLTDKHIEQTIFLREYYQNKSLKYSNSILGQEELLNKIDIFEKDNINLQTSLTQAYKEIEELNLNNKVLKD